MIPIAGSAYTYGYATLGEFVAWIIGWDLILEYLFGAATVAVGWSGYFAAFLERARHHAAGAVHRRAARRGGNAHARAIADLLSIRRRTTSITVAARRPSATATRYAVRAASSTSRRWSSSLLMTALLVIGIKESARFNNVDRDREDRDRAARDRLRLHVRQLGELARRSFPPNTGDVRAVRLERHRSRRRRHLLRLHRIRRRVHRGAGSEESADATCRSAFSARSRSARCSTS